MENMSCFAFPKRVLYSVMSYRSVRILICPHTLPSLVNIHRLIHRHPRSIPFPPQPRPSKQAKPQYQIMRRRLYNIRTGPNRYYVYIQLHHVAKTSGPYTRPTGAATARQAELSYFVLSACICDDAKTPPPLVEGDRRSRCFFWWVGRHFFLWRMWYLRVNFFWGGAFFLASDWGGHPRGDDGGFFFLGLKPA